MSRIEAIDPSEATGKVKQLLDGIQAKFGRTPNLIRMLAHSPAALEAYLNQRETLNAGELGAKFGQQIALAVSQANSCEYFVAVHTYIGKNAFGLDDAEILLNRRGRSADPRTAAGLEFAGRVLEARGAVTDEDLARVRAAGFTEGEIVEIVSHVALNLLTNYFDLTARTDLDFPGVPLALEPIEPLAAV